MSKKLLLKQSKLFTNLTSCPVRDTVHSSKEHDERDHERNAQTDQNFRRETLTEFTEKRNQLILLST